ncbi:hypothetical protein [Rhizobium tubonense]|uniref:hypothetical protein n=1 Tax=Rhizobium tubonense TaxID=484088 RepID=UPI0011B7C85E|nr:hypothetical protein [Rhizobium tubonense]
MRWNTKQNEFLIGVPGRHTSQIRQSFGITSKGVEVIYPPGLGGEELFEIRRQQRATRNSIRRSLSTSLQEMMVKGFWGDLPMVEWIEITSGSIDDILEVH